MGMNFNPEAQEKGSLWDGGPGTIVTMRAVMFDYNGQQEPGPSIHVHIVAHEDGKEHDEYYSVGKADTWAPSDDGLTFVPLKKGRSGANDNSNGAYLFNSLVAAGFPQDQIGEDLSIFDDMDCTFARQKIERTIKGETKTSNPLLISSIERMPGAAKPAKGKPGTAKAPVAAAGKGAMVPKAPAKAAPAKANAAADLAEETIVEILTEAGEPVTKKKLGIKLLTKLKGNPQTKAAVEQCNDLDWLFADDRPWVSDTDAETVGLPE